MIYSKIILKGIWDLLSLNQKEHACQYVTDMPSEFIHEKWVDMPQKQRSLVCKYQRNLLEPFFSIRWYDMTEEQRDSICCYHKLPNDFILSYWDNITEKQTKFIYIYQREVCSEIWEKFKEKDWFKDTIHGK